MLLQRIQGRDDLLPQHAQGWTAQRGRGDGAGKAGAKKPDIPSVLNKTSQNCWYPNTRGPWISRFHPSFCQHLSLTHPWKFPPLPLPSCWGPHGSREGGRLSMETLIRKVPMAGGVRRVVGEGASPEVNAWWWSSLARTMQRYLPKDLINIFMTARDQEWISLPQPLWDFLHFNLCF